MSSPKRKAEHGINDEYGWIDEMAGDLYATARDLIAKGEASRVSDEAIRQLLTAALRLYVARTDGEERTFRPLMGKYDEEVRATEVISACTELLRALRLSPMELSIWWRQRPEGDEF